MNFSHTISPLQRFGFTNWYRSKPSSKRDKNCLIFNYWNKGMWSDEYCDYNKAFICQNQGKHSGLGVLINIEFR